MKYFILAAVALANVALASNREAGDIITRAGIGVVLPAGSGLDTGLGTIKADNAYEITLTGVYMITDQIGVELLASTVWTHDIELDGAKIGEAKQLPPTLSLQWHTPAIGRIQPYVGLGINWTIFMSEKITTNDPPLAGSSLSLDDSFGIAVQGGFDFDITEKWLINADLRWINIETDAQTSALGELGTVKINPWIFSLNAGYRF